MPDGRLSLPGLRAQGALVERNLTPAGKEKAASADDFLSHVHGAHALQASARQEEKADRNFPFRVKAGIQAAGFTSKECRWELGEKAGAVAARAVGIDAAAVGERSQTFQSLFDDAMGGRTIELSHEAHTAGVVLLSSIKSGTPVTFRFVRHIPQPFAAEVRRHLSPSARWLSSPQSGHHVK